jgi:hypothetical protein
MKKRMLEMVEASVINRHLFGHVFDLPDGESFLNTVDNTEHKCIMTIILIWDPNVTSCRSINACLQTIAKDYSHVKFCRIQVKP